MVKNYSWTDNPTEANVALYDPDILNECLMHLKYQNEKLPKFCINSASVDINGNPNLLSYQNNTIKFNCGNSIVPIMSSNSQNEWTISASHQIISSSNDFYKSFDNLSSDYCALQHTPSEEAPAFLAIEKSTDFSCDYLYLKFKSTINPGDILSFIIYDGDENILYSYDNLGDYLNKDEFLIPIYNFNGRTLKFSVTSVVNDATYTNFPSVIKLLVKTQVITLTNPKGEIGNLLNISDFIIPSVANKTYTVFADLNGNIETFNTTLSKGITLPSGPNVDQIHLLTCVEPIQVKKYNGSRWEEYNKIPIGYAKTNSSGVISEVVTFAYNQNSYNLSVLSFVQNLAPSGWTKLPNGLIIQWGNNTWSGTSLNLVNFPIAFSTSCLAVTANRSAGGSSNQYSNNVNCENLTVSSVQMKKSAAESMTATWIAVGY